MQVYDAKVADIVRCSQRDELFTKQLEDDIFSILKLFGARNYNQLRKIVPLLANSWYYFLTSLDNLQTLGEEYTGTLRFANNNKLPSKLIQVLWLVLYIGGESLYDNLLSHLKLKVTNSKSIVENARNQILKWIQFLKENKIILLRLHKSLFYVDGIYYNLSNRVTGIKYVLLRHWLQDDSSTWSFKLLGRTSLIYLLCTLIHRALTINTSVSQNTTFDSSISFTKLCSLCAETRKNTSVTPCGHLFCWECMYDSLNYQKNCPICREAINPSRIIFLQNYV